jgi:hypothetical protein
LAGILCQPHPELIMQKHKSTTVVTASTLRKTSRKHGHGRKSNHYEAQTSAQELAMAKPVKPRKKFVVASSGLGPIVGVGAVG